MQRSRLKNIINKSRELSSRDSFDSFKNSLPKELDYYKDGEKYRLRAAWEAYGKPKDLYEAQWNGLVENLHGKVIMPSIGYNESLDRYEYLNTGKDNDEVNKDIRVWDNDVIPFVQELKLGGYIRTFNDEENCWTYSKQHIEELKKGGSLRDKIKTYDDFLTYLESTNRDGNDYDYQGFWNDNNEKNKWFDDEETKGQAHFTDKYKLPSHFTFSTDSKYSNSITPGGTWIEDKNGHWTYETSPYVESQHSLEEMRDYFQRNEPHVTLIYKGVPYYSFADSQKFKNGGQMNVIPDGALHARKNNMKGAGEDYTAKGIPVMDKENNQVAEIEKEEVIFNKDLTNFIESNLKKFNDASNSEQDEIAINVGKRLVKELLENTEDNTGLIDRIKEE